MPKTLGMHASDLPGRRYPFRNKLRCLCRIFGKETSGSQGIVICPVLLPQKPDSIWGAKAKHICLGVLVLNITRFVGGSQLPSNS